MDVRQGEGGSGSGSVRSTSERPCPVYKSRGPAVAMGAVPYLD